MKEYIKKPGIDQVDKHEKDKSKINKKWAIAGAAVAGTLVLGSFGCNAVMNNKEAEQTKAACEKANVSIKETIEQADHLNNDLKLVLSTEFKDRVPADLVAQIDNTKPNVLDCANISKKDVQEAEKQDEALKALLAENDFSQNIDAIVSDINAKAKAEGEKTLKVLNENKEIKGVKAEDIKKLLESDASDLDGSIQKLKDIQDVSKKVAEEKAKIDKSKIDAAIQKANEVKKNMTADKEYAAYKGYELHVAALDKVIDAAKKSGDVNQVKKINDAAKALEIDRQNFKQAQKEAAERAAREKAAAEAAARQRAQAPARSGGGNYQAPAQRGSSNSYTPPRRSSGGSSYQAPPRRQAPAPAPRPAAPAPRPAPAPAPAPAPKPKQCGTFTDPNGIVFDKCTGRIISRPNWKKDDSCKREEGCRRVVG